MKLTKALVIASLPLFLAACSDSDSNSYSTVDFSVSDAPVEGLSDVMIAFDLLEFIHSDGERTFHDINGVQQINLLDYPGSQAALIISDIALRTGEYKNLIIHISPESGLNYVMNKATPGVEEDLKQPSNKLKLGGFTVADEAVQAFTIEFDLRQSLVMRGNSGNNNGYILKPHGVTIIDNDSAASLKGTVDSILFDDNTCVKETGNYVYLYAGHVAATTRLVDNFDSNDVDFSGPLPDSDSLAPYASTAVDLSTGDYSFGFLPPGDYTVAFSCSAVDDDPVKFDDLLIPDPSLQSAQVTLPDSQELIYDFEAD